MNSKKLFSKKITKSAALLLVGVSVLGAGSANHIYAKSFSRFTMGRSQKITWSKVNYFKPVCVNPSVIVKNNCNPTKPTTPGTTTPETTVPETTTPETTTPETTIPETTVPETTVPETTVPETTVPETTVPETTTPETTTPEPTAPVENTTQNAAFENQVLVLVNQERAKQGLNPLTMDESVRNVARTKSTDMSKNRYFSHTSPTYGSPFDMLKQFGVSYRSAGENIAQGYATPAAVVQGWMNSSGHRANILNSGYTHIGVGYEASGNYWTQMFISK